MRTLLKNKERRQLGIVEYLLEAENWTTISELVTLFDSSPRVLKADIAEMRNTYTDLIFETCYLGIRLNTKPSTGIQIINANILKESLQFNILEEIFFNETHSIESLADIFFVSHSTIYRTINQLNEFFSSHYDCHIELTPCRFIGNEQNIRLFYRTYFTEKYSLMGWPFKDYDESKANDLLNKVLSFIKLDNPLDFAFYETIKIVVHVNKIRFDFGHRVETSKEESDLLNSFFEIFRFVLQPLGFFKNLELERESLYQIFGPYIYKGVAKNIKQLNKFMKQNDYKGKALRQLSDSLKQLAKEWDFTINLDTIIFNVHNVAVNAIDLLNSDFILFDRNKKFLISFKETAPEIYTNLHLYVTNFCQQLHLSVNEKTINYLMFTLITHWEGLLSQYLKQNSHLSLILISDKSLSHAKLIKDLLEFELPQNIQINLFQQTELTERQLLEIPDEIIITNFPLPKSLSHKSIVIHDYPTKLDLININELIETVRITQLEQS